MLAKLRFVFRAELFTVFDFVETDLWKRHFLNVLKTLTLQYLRFR